MFWSTIASVPIGLLAIVVDLYSPEIRQIIAKIFTRANKVLVVQPRFNGELREEPETDKAFQQVKQDANPEESQGVFLGSDDQENHVFLEPK